MIDSYFSRFRFVGGSRNSSVHRSDWRSFGQILYHLKSKHDKFYNSIICSFCMSAKRICEIPNTFTIVFMFL